MNDLTPCIVWYSFNGKPGSYTSVMIKRKAIEVAENWAAQGYRSVVYSLNEISNYAGLSAEYRTKK